MFQFDDLDSEIQTRIPDRPPRKVPEKLPTMPEIPWLASRYEPTLRNTPSAKNRISTIVSTAIPVLGTLGVIGLLIYGAVKLFSLY